MLFGVSGREDYVFGVFGRDDFPPGLLGGPSKKKKVQDKSLRLEFVLVFSSRFSARFPALSGLDARRALMGRSILRRCRLEAWKLFLHESDPRSFAETRRQLNQAAARFHMCEFLYLCTCIFVYLNLDSNLSTVVVQGIADMTGMTFDRQDRDGRHGRIFQKMAGNK